MALRRQPSGSTIPKLLAGLELDGKPLLASRDGPRPGRAPARHRWRRNLRVDRRQSRRAGRVSFRSQARLAEDCRSRCPTGTSIVDREVATPACASSTSTRTATTTSCSRTRAVSRRTCSFAREGLVAATRRGQARRRRRDSADRSRRHQQRRLGSRPHAVCAERRHRQAARPGRPHAARQLAQGRVVPGSEIARSNRWP